LRPSFAIAHGNLASCFYDEGNMEMAVKLYKHAIQLEPNFPDAYNNLGNAYREVGCGDLASVSLPGPVAVTFWCVAVNCGTISCGTPRIR
jgi:tetratricopeptide (TPR) repeat protein